MAKKKEQTPLMKQYLGVKSAHPDKVVLFRMGDFFEMFDEDARIAAPILGIALTARNKKSGDQTAMCGVPHHSIAGHINKLLQSGHKVAICDQVEDAKQAKGLVKREVTRILSPGMVYDPETLDAHTPNYLCSFSDDCLAFMDSTTGECFFYVVSDFKRKTSLLRALQPVEVIIQEGQKENLDEMLGENHSVLISVYDEKFEGYDSLPKPARRLLAYALYMQGESALQSLKPFEERDCHFRLQLTPNVLRHLEVFKTYKGEKQGTLFSAMDRTKTAGGGRLLRSWVLFPLAEKKQIEKRHGEVAFWSRNIEELKTLRQSLFAIGDLERRLTKVTQPTCHPRDIVSLGNSLESALELVPKMRDFSQAEEIFNNLKPLSDKIDLSFVEEVPNNFRDGGFIAQGINPQLDELIELSTKSQQKVRELEEKEKELTGITSLKVRYNNVFGYYIEVTNTHKAKVPTDRYQRKQTLTNAERYVTDELNELEKKVITAKSRRSEVELEMFSSLKEEIMKSMKDLLLLAHHSSQLDVYTSLAWLALENDFVKPEMSEKGAIVLEGSRHPVVEQFVEKNFVANDIELKPEQCVLLTGP
ncbi:MAG: DNA mismatch repair protein MutS, partial [Bdellovibrionales bacterium]|nr:DNA mismatch repair protein MutS [Bdellovibrionales bacterium]NQZ17990.1 DNA mismatch repair protein MutS [Bdellovibrionales bacterium]